MDVTSDRIAISIQQRPCDRVRVELVHVDEQERETVVGGATASTEAEARELAWQDFRERVS